MGQEEDTTASHWVSKNKKEKRAHAMPSPLHANQPSSRIKLTDTSPLYISRSSMYHKKLLKDRIGITSMPT